MVNSLPPATRAGQSLPEDIISDILLRLPVKILLRCRAVSKSWKTLISSPNFVKSHLYRTIASPSADQTIIVHTYEIFKFSGRSISLLNVSSAQFESDFHLPYLKDEFPFIPNTCLAGSAGGIVCVCVCGPFDVSQCTNYITDCPIDYIYLWNPATKLSIRIPQHTIDVKNTHWIIGFGFDHVSNDFKVVRIVLSPFSAEVFSTNGNCWRKVEQVVHNSVGSYMYNDIFVCVKGYLCCTRISHMIAFDLNKEVLKCGIELPVNSAIARITEFNDSIAVVNWVDMDEYYNIKLWKLENEACLGVGGVEASWTLMLNIDHKWVECVHGYLNSGEFLICLGDDIWYLYDPDMNVERNVPRLFYEGQIFKYTESLVTFPGSKLVDWSAVDVENEVYFEGIDRDEDENETQG